MMRLHLGCGQRYFEGYVNIDYPLTEHTVQHSSVADEFHDLTDMRHAAGSIDEIRLHHVFEHFPRARAAALLASWNSWLRIGGRLHMEVPDFGRTGRAVLGAFSSPQARMVGLRHIFGSQEAPWAVHYEGYTKTTLQGFLRRFAFEPRQVRLERWKHTHNLIVIAEKRSDLTLAAAEDAAREHLRQYMVDDSASETALLEVWMEEFRAQLARTHAPRG